MALNGSRSERQSLGISKKSYGKSYGSLQKSKQEIYIKHIVSESDTLQGLALKYGVTIEQIKRANKLFTTDSIFLRKVLNIPVGEQPLPAHLLETATASLTNGNGNGTSDTTPMIPKSKEESESENEAEPEIDAAKVVLKEGVKEDEATLVTGEEPRDETMDFFNRIDRQMRTTKTEVKRIEENSSLKELEAQEPPAPNPAAQYDYKTKSTPAYQGDTVVPTATYSNPSSSTGSPKIFAKAKSLFGRKDSGSKKLVKADSQAEELLHGDQDGFYQL